MATRRRLQRFVVEDFGAGAGEAEALAVAIFEAVEVDAFAAAVAKGAFAFVAGELAGWERDLHPLLAEEFGVRELAVGAHLLFVLGEVGEKIAGAVLGGFAGGNAKALIQVRAEFRVEVDKSGGHFAPVTKFEGALADTGAGDDADRVGSAAVDFDEDDGSLPVGVQVAIVEKLAAGLVNVEAAQGELGHADAEDLAGAEVAVGTFGLPEKLLELSVDGLCMFSGRIGCEGRHVTMLRRCILARMADSAFAGAQWWQTGVIYQIYPRSFQDSNGNGVGDLKGIAARLDYLVSLGVDAIWISPIYPSPMADFGYDVADYCGVDPLFGTMEDFDALLAAAHAKGLRVILDFVPNHSSDQHPWFLESRSSRWNPKRDWYLWRDPHPVEQSSSGTPNDAAAPSGPDDHRPASQRYPNNWTSHFGGPSWAWDEATGQFYLHSFLKEQPDLNWRNPEVRAAIYEAMRFWLDKGVDGFRMDVLWLLIKDEQFRDNPSNTEYAPGMHDHAKTLPLYNADQPGTHRIVAAMRALMDSYRPTLPGTGEVEGALDPETLAPMATSNRVLIGEIYPAPAGAGAVLLWARAADGRNRRDVAGDPGAARGESAVQLPPDPDGVECNADCGDCAVVRVAAAGGRVAQLRAGEP